LHDAESRLSECLPPYQNIQVLLHSVRYMATSIVMQQNDAVIAFTIVFVLDLITQFLTCMTLMVCTDVSSHSTMSRSRKPSVRREEKCIQGFGGEN